MIRSISSGKFSAGRAAVFSRTCLAAAGILRHHSAAMRADPLAARDCRSAPICFRPGRPGRIRPPLPPPAGSNFELTRQMALQVLQVIQREARTENVEICLGFAGQIAPNFGMDNMVLFMRGPTTAGCGCFPRIERHQPRRVSRAAAEGAARAGRAVAGQAAGAGRVVAGRGPVEAKPAIFGFEPGDIVSEVMSFGSPTPIAVRVVSTDLDDGPQHAENRRRDEEDPLPARRAVRAVARLPDRRGRHRSREGGPEGRDGRGRGQCAGHGHLAPAALPT